MGVEIITKPFGTKSWFSHKEVKDGLAEVIKQGAVLRGSSVDGEITDPVTNRLKGPLDDILPSEGSSLPFEADIIYNNKKVAYVCNTSNGYLVNIYG